MIARASLGIALVVSGCHCEETKVAESPQEHLQVVAAAATPPPSPLSPVATSAAAPPPPPRPALPSEIEVGIPTEYTLPTDRNLRITHAAGTQERAIVYLHGMCGNSKGADPWADVAVDFGTLIVVRANVPCEDRPGFKWPKDLEGIQDRIDAALRETARLRNGRLDTQQVALFGYSQGANRAEKLAGRSPGRYPWVVLGGTPAVAVPERLLGTRAVAFLGGELEDVSHMREGVARLEQVDHPARFFLLPGVHHGSYGPAGSKVVREALTFVFGVEPG